MGGNALVLQPWKPGIVHHGVDLGQHGVHRTDTDLSLDLISSKEDLISDLMTSSTGPLLFHNSAENTPRLFSYAI